MSRILFHVERGTQVAFVVGSLIQVFVKLRVEIYTKLDLNSALLCVLWATDNLCVPSVKLCVFFI